MGEPQRKYVDVSVEFIDEVLKNSNSNLPDSATLRSITYQPEHHTYKCVFQSSEWGERVEAERVLELGAD